MSSFVEAPTNPGHPPAYHQRIEHQYWEGEHGAGRHEVAGLPVTAQHWGVSVYEFGPGTVTGRGLAVVDLDKVLPLAVARMSDEDGMARLRAMLEDLATTDFATAEIEKILSAPGAAEPWRVGEAIAEAYLVHERACTFPWHASRDQKNPKGSSPGCDLVGFQLDEQVRFAFAEVKTSADHEYPPSVVHGRGGLDKQIEALMGSKTATWNLIRYLGVHATNADWEGLYKEAAGHYLANTNDLRLFGFLVRDVLADGRDLSGRIDALKDDCCPPTQIELYALYLPESSIPQLPRRAAAIKKAS